MPSHILLLGHEPILLKTRCWILEQQGYEVSGVSTIQALEEMLVRRPTDVLILCHSLPRGTALTASERVAALQPSVKLLLLTASQPYSPLEQSHAVCSAFDGPQLLVNAVHSLLRSPGNLC